MYLFYFVCFVAVSLASTASVLPKDFPVCGRKGDKSKIDQCMLETTEKIKSILIPGIRKLNFPPLNPLVIPEINLEQGSDSATYKASVKNVAVFGLENYKFQKLDFNFEQHKTAAVVDIPGIYIEGLYVISGKILSAPIEGEGLCKFNISHVKAVLDVNSKVEKVDGVEYLKHYQYDLKLDIGPVTSHSIEGLFKDNEVLSKAVKDTLQNNINDLVQTMKPAVEQVITDLFKSVYFKKLDTIPYDILFPPREN